MTDKKTDNSAPSQSKKIDRSFSKDFTYTHKNPYHDRLEEFSGFVLRDEEAEKHRGSWNTDVFSRQAPLHVEIGSGFGHFMLAYCEDHPEVNFVGMDYRFKRSFQLAKKLKSHPHQNFRYLRAKGERVEFIFGQQEVEALYYFFPDPWPKTRHHKKRLFQEPFLQAAHKVLTQTGKIYIKTDHDGYAQWMKEHIEKTTLFTCTMESWDLHNDQPDHFLAHYQTKFEKIFLGQGIKIKAFVLEKN
jgi:tRNA (guanine-N7-)-methyltransferase